MLRSKTKKLGQRLSKKYSVNPYSENQFCFLTHIYPPQKKNREEEEVSIYIYILRSARESIYFSYFELYTSSQSHLSCCWINRDKCLGNIVARVSPNLTPPSASAGRRKWKLAVGYGISFWRILRRRRRRSRRFFLGHFFALITVLDIRRGRAAKSRPHKSPGTTRLPKGPANPPPPPTSRCLTYTQRLVRGHSYTGLKCPYPPRKQITLNCATPEILCICCAYTIYMKGPW